MTDTIQADTQPKDPRELLKTIRPLLDERRLEAYERAKTIVVKAAGKMPEPKDFQQHTEAKYPPWMNWLINGLCLLVLLAAFAPSAIRLYQIGSMTFAESIPHSASASVAGLSILLLSEAAMVLFSIAGVVMIKGIATKTEDGKDTPEAKAEKNVKRLLAFSQFVATLIAVVGNGQVSLPGHINNPFAWIEAFAPSILIYSTSAVLKAQLLTAVERRHANTRAYQMALNAWNTATSQPETDARFRPALHNALRDLLREDNGKGLGAAARKDYMAAFLLVDWQRLVKRELDADQWYVDPDAPAYPSAVHPPSALNGRMNGTLSVQAESIRYPSALNERMDGYAVQSASVHPPSNMDEQRMDGADSLRTNGRNHGTGEGYGKNMGSREVALEFFRRQSQYITSKETTDEVEALLLKEMFPHTAGRTTIGNVRKELRMKAERGG